MNIEKIIHIVAGIVLTLFVVGVSYGIITAVSSEVDRYTTEFDNTTTQILESKYTKYDGTPTSGSTVLNLIKTTYSSVNDDPIYILVKTASNTVGVYYVCDSSGTKLDSSVQSGLVRNAQKKGNGNYVMPSASFTGQVDRDSNGSIIGITFTQE